MAICRMVQGQMKIILLLSMYVSLPVCLFGLLSISLQLSLSFSNTPVTKLKWSSTYVWSLYNYVLLYNTRHTYLLLGMDDGRILFMDPVIRGQKYMEFKASKDSVSIILSFAYTYPQRYENNPNSNTFWTYLSWLASQSKGNLNYHRL